VIDAHNIKQTVRTLGTAFADFDASTLQNAQAPIKAMAEFVSNYAKVAGGLQEVSPGLIDQISEKVIGWFGGTSPIKKLAGESATMVDTLATLTVNFKALGEYLGKTPEMAVEAIKVSADVVKGFNPLAKAVEESGEHIENLADGWIFSGPMTALQENMPTFTKAVSGIVSELTRTFAEVPKTAFESVKMGIEVADQAVSGFANMARRLAPIGDQLERASEHANRILEATPAVARALKGIISSAGEVVGLTQKMNVSPVPVAQVQQAVSVQLDPDTTDKPVHERLGQTNSLLSQIVGLLQSGGAQVAFAGARAGGGMARGVGPQTSEIAAGRY